MLTPAQRKRLTELENESIQVSFERTRYTFDHSPQGIEKWDQLWARRIQIDKEIERLKGVDSVQAPQTTVPA